jgi:hypothetical protein
MSFFEGEEIISLYITQCLRLWFWVAYFLLPEFGCCGELDKDNILKSKEKGLWETALFPCRKKCLSSLIVKLIPG